MIALNTTSHIIFCMLSFEEVVKKDADLGIIIDRKSQIANIEDNLLKHLRENHPESAVSLYIYGTTGTGKTYICDYYLESEIKKMNNPYYVYYKVNASENSSGTLYKIIINLLKVHLKKYLPVEVLGEQIDSIPLKGLDLTFLFDILYAIIEKYQLTIIIAIDEIDKIIKNQGDTFIQGVIDARLKNGHLYLVGISNDPNLDANFSVSVKARYRYKILFSKYNAPDLFEILQTFNQKFNLSCDERDLRIIAGEVADKSGSARDAKQTFLEYYLNGKNIKNIEDYMEKSELTMFESNIYSLPTDEKIILYALIKVIKFYNVILMKSGDKTARRFLPTAQTVYKVYNKLSSTSYKKGKTFRSFKNAINDLDAMNIINLTKSGFGRARGTFHLIAPTFSIEVIEPMIERLLADVIEKPIKDIYELKNILMPPLNMF